MFNNIQSRRSHESPMDWEWQTQGPTDPKSPFPQFKPQHGQKQGFESNQASSSFIAASSAPAPQFRNPSFTTPRKPFDQELFSEVSGAESSPADNADAEDTPDPPKTSQTMTAFTNGGTVRQPMFGRYGSSFLGSSPGRAEQRRGKYANTIINKVRKRKRIDRDYALVRGHREGSDSESDGDESRPRSGGQQSKQESKEGWFASTFNYIESHPNLPNVLSIYAQMAINFFIAGLTVFGIYTFWMTVRADVDKASDDERALVLAETVRCARDYVDNRCGSDQRLPALQIPCESWEHCMNRDPNSIGRARVSAHTFAQIFNSFIEPISYKAMIFVVLIVTVCILVNNLAFGMFRSKVSHIPPAQPFFPPNQHQQNFQWGAPPQTPQHTVGYDVYGGQTYQAIMPSQTPGQRSPSKGNRSPSKEERSPSKGRRSPSKGERF
ncbi:Di-sulfide bridge nucleocytoplasmic transport domain-containing protein [Hyaloscypha finlandica]|nr:Di-sulfide bridge nucleocytoplasmic transport domain-containing protein [Hyaloscypha finlandica]